MNAAQLVGRRLMQFGNLDMTIPKDRDLYYELTEHIIIIEKKFPIQRLPDVIARIEQRYNRKVEVIGMDYLQIQPVADPNNMNRFIRNGTERADFMAEYLPEAMKDIDASMVMCGQPKQSLEGFGVVPLTGEAFKNGQACAAMCGKMMTILRPLKGSHADAVFSMWVVKNRDGETSDILNYNWTGKQMLIGGPFTGEIVHKPPITFDGD